MLDKPIQMTPGQVWAAITAVAALVGATAYVTWEIRKDYVDDLKRQIDSYEKSNNLKLPATLGAIKDASDALVLNAAEKKELTQLRTDSTSLRDRVQKLAVEHDEAKKKLASAQDELARVSVPVTTIELNEGDSKFLIENTVNLALRTASSSRAYIRLANKERTVDLGETIEYEAGMKHCRLTLLKGTSSNARFHNSCA